MHNESPLDKFIVFKIANYLLALPIRDVLRVINISAANSNQPTTMGLVQLGKYIIKVLDLHQHLHLGSLPDSADNPSFIVVAYDSQGELYGISLNEPPDLVELPTETIRSLPKSRSQSRPIFDMVSHVAVLSQQEVTKTIFVLDSERIAEYV